MATKASQTPHFQSKPTMLELLVRRDLHSWRLRRITSSTNLMPICLHLVLLQVLLWYLPKGGFYTCPPQGVLCSIVKADSFFRTNLMVKDICYISYSCMFVATSLSSPTFTADCTWAFILHPLNYSWLITELPRIMHYFQPSCIPIG